MRTWKRAVVPESCGRCAHLIAPGAVFMDVRIGVVNLQRCGPCASSLFDEAVPATVPDDDVLGPQPTLKVDTERQPDFVTTQQLTRHNRFNEFRRRRIGEVE